MTGFVVTLLVLLGLPLLMSTRSRVKALEYRLKLVEDELRRRIAAERTANSETLRAPAPVPSITEAPAAALPEQELQPSPVDLPAPHPEPSEALAAAEPEVVRTEAPEPETETAPEPEVVIREAPEQEPALHYAEAPEQPEPVRRAPINFEELFGRRLPIWAGGITLAIAGVLIVKYAIDIGLFGRIFTPGVQAVCGMLFGFGLIGGAEWAWRQQDKVEDPRVSQALSGAGISTLYAALLVASNVYGLISPLTAFFGLALVTAGALWLSLRHGMPSALLGLAGGLAAPALTVGLDANVPMLATYLAFTIAGLVGVSRMQRWPWLALIALAGGAGWSLWLIVAGQALSAMGAVSVGMFVMLLAIALPLLAFREAAASLLRAASAVIGALQLALLVAMGGYQPLHWGLFILIAAAGQWLAWRGREFAVVPTIGAALSVLMLMLWPQPATFWLALVGLALLAIHAAPLLAKLWREPVQVQFAIELAAIAAAVPLVVLRHLHAPWGAIDPAGAWAAAGGAALVLLGAALGWKVRDRGEDLRMAVLLGTGGLLLSLAAWLGFAHWQAPLWIGAVALALLGLAPASRDRRIEPLGAGFTGLALLTLAITFLPGRLGEVGALFGEAYDPLDHTSLLRWAGLAAVFALYAWRAQMAAIRIEATALAVAFLYGAAAQLVPDWSLPMVMAALAAALLFVLRARETPQTEHLALAYAVASGLLLPITMAAPHMELARLTGDGPDAASALSALRWLAPAALALLLAARSRLTAVRAAGQVGAVLLAYGSAAQVLPGWSLPLIAAAALPALAAFGKRLPLFQTAIAAGTLAALMGAWAMLPLGYWLAEALASLAARPMLLDSPELAPLAVLRRLLAPALLAAAALSLRRESVPQRALIAGAALAGAVGVIALHCLYRAGFAGLLGADFVRFGLGQRLVWEALLIAGAVLLWKRGRGIVASRAAPVLLGAAMGHAAYYSLLLHNPLWTHQHVGPLPIANLILPLFTLLPASLMLLARMLDEIAPLVDRALQPLLMVMVALLGWASLRHAFHGTLLVDPGVSGPEDILRSILGIALAVGYLLWGIRTRRHDWRIASLVLMLAAVAKVFLFDASGLEGLLRIGSFVALGFSLIGIGWLYSRQLRREGH